MTSVVVPILVALISSFGVWLVQFLVTRHQREEQERRDRETHDQESRDRKLADSDLLAASQKIAQQTALDSADKRYQGLQQDHENLKHTVTDVRQAALLIINAFEGYIIRLRPIPDADAYSAIVSADEVEIARRTIMEARERLFQ